MALIDDLILRSVKLSELTAEDHDANFTNIAEAITIDTSVKNIYFKDESSDTQEVWDYANFSLVTGGGWDGYVNMRASFVNADLADNASTIFATNLRYQSDFDFGSGRSGG